MGNMMMESELHRNNGNSVGSIKWIHKWWHMKSNNGESCGSGSMVTSAVYGTLINEKNGGETMETEKEVQCRNEN